VTDAKIPGLQERFVDARGVRMRYFVGGRGRPVLLLHGLSGSADNWVDTAPLLARRHLVLAPDLPGHGGSAPLPAVTGLAGYADRVRLVAAHEQALPAAVVGHSLGGLLALRLALRHPDDVRALILAASAGIETTTRRARFWLTVLGYARPTKAIAPLRGLLGRYPWLRRPVFSSYEVADARSLTPRMVEGFLSASRLHEDVRGAARALVRDDPRRDLARVQPPCLVVWGARDRMLPVCDAFELARRLGAELRLVADCGHLLIGERPAVVVDAIESFLDRVREVDELPGQVEARG
jgi:pimeloyl-ACP methyl ester carboxylesterase